MWRHIWSFLRRLFPHPSVTITITHTRRWSITARLMWSLMAKSIFDIPPQFRTPYSKQSFILWLADLPLAPAPKRALVSTWSKLTGISFSSSDFERAQIPMSGE